MRATTIAVIVACASLLQASREADAAAPAWEVTRGEVRVVCPMTVGGSFEAKTQALSGTLEEATPHPLGFDGRLTVDLATLDTGIGLRNDHLRREYLEVGKGAGFDKAVLSDIRLADIDPATFQGRTDFTGRFTVHGETQPVAGRLEIRREGAAVRVDATFPLALADYGIPKPQYLGIGVRPEVEVKVSLVARPATVATAGGR